MAKKKMTRARLWGRMEFDDGSVQDATVDLRTDSGRDGKETKQTKSRRKKTLQEFYRWDRFYTPKQVALTQLIEKRAADVLMDPDELTLNWARQFMDRLVGRAEDLDDVEKTVRESLAVKDPRE